jgi:hypothetical protein
MDESKRSFARRLVIAACIMTLVAALGAWFSNSMSPAKPQAANEPMQPVTYQTHSSVRASMFWVGENADASNDFIDNKSSAWLQNWVSAFGGVDTPDKRCGNAPCGFTPKENAFYFALPYNDLDDSCHAKASQKQVPWYSGTTTQGQSIIKNHWIEVRYNNKAVYAQWEDAGPSGEDNATYVFGNGKPTVTYGLDLSPATANYLDTKGDALVSWRFINEGDVPDGPWRSTVTNSAPDCAQG